MRNWGHPGSPRNPALLLKIQYLNGTWGLIGKRPIKHARELGMADTALHICEEGLKLMSFTGRASPELHSASCHPSND